MVGLNARGSALEDAPPGHDLTASPGGRPFVMVAVSALQAGEDFAGFVQRYYPHLIDHSGRLDQGRLISFDLVPELTQKINQLCGDKVIFSEARFITPMDIPENHNGAGSFQLSAGETQNLITTLQAYGFSAVTEKLYDYAGYWDYAALSVPAVPELELVRMQYRRLASKNCGASSQLPNKQDRADGDQPG